MLTPTGRTRMNVQHLAAVGIDLEHVGAVLENQGAALAQDSLISALDRLPARWGHR